MSNKGLADMIAQPAVDAAMTVLDGAAVASGSMPGSSWINRFFGNLWDKITFGADIVGGVGIYVILLLILLLINKPEVLLLAA